MFSSRTSWDRSPNRLAALLEEGASGQELRERSFAGDVQLAATLDASLCVPRLVDGAFVQYGQGSPKDTS